MASSPAGPWASDSIFKQPRRYDDLISGPSWFETRGVAALLTMRVAGPHPEERALPAAQLRCPVRASRRDVATTLEKTTAAPSHSRGARRPSCAFIFRP